MRRNKSSHGKIIDNKYVKEVNWNKAVLWMSKKISIAVSDSLSIIHSDIDWVEFHDRTKGEVVVRRASKESVVKAGQYETHGQEEQYYIPIEIFSISKGVN